MDRLQQLTELALENKEELHIHGRLVRYIFVKDKQVRFANNEACYYQMEHGVPWSKGITGIISSLSPTRRKLDKDKLRAWLEFHVNDPVFGQAILSKDIDWMMEHRLVISDTSAPGNLMQGVLVSIRQLWEYDQIVNSYYELRKADINPCLAYNLAHWLYVDKDNYKLENYGPGHNLFYGHKLTKRHFKNWFDGVLDQPLKPYVEHSAYTGTERMFDRQYTWDDEYKLSTWFRGWCKKIMNPVKSTNTNNPFGKAKAVNKVSVYPCEELNALIKEHEEELIKELTNV